MTALRAHVVHLLVAGVALILLMVLLGASWQLTLLWALLLACPLAMVVMMSPMPGDDRSSRRDAPSDGSDPDPGRISGPPNRDRTCH